MLGVPELPALVCVPVDARAWRRRGLVFLSLRWNGSVPPVGWDDERMGAWLTS